MVNQPIIIAATNLTKHLIVVLYYNSAPLVEVKRIVKAPGDDNVNFVFVDVNPGMATISWYESDDGEELTTLLSGFQIEISRQIAVFQERWYTVGGIQSDDDGNIVDPIPGERLFTDPFLDGKIVTSLTKRGSGPIRYGKEWSREANTITLLNPENQLPDGPVFVENDEWLALLTFLQDVVVSPPQTKIFYDEITEDTVLTPAHRNKRIYLNGSSTRLKLFAEPLSEIPDGDWYEFVCNGGNQYQTTIDLQEGDAVNIDGIDKPALYIGRFETWRMFKRGDKFDIEKGLDYLCSIGQFVKSYKNTEVNALPCDGIKRSGLDYPRAKEYILQLDTDTAINSSTVSIQDIGCWHYWEEDGEWFFRTPNKQNMYGRNLKSFSSRGTDTERLYDYGGGLQTERVGKHRHFNILPTGESRTGFPDIINWLMSIKNWWYKTGGGAEGYQLEGSYNEPSVGRTSEGHTEGESGPVALTENRTTNVGEFEFVRI